jgi:DNA processing protein
MRSLLYSELQYRIALTMAPDIGPVAARRLIEHFKSARAVFKQTPQGLETVEGIGPRSSGSICKPGLMELAEKEMQFLERHRISVLCLGENGYPDRLGKCHDAPFLLFVRGEQGLHCRHSLSIVGTRKATSYGRDVCHQIVLDLSRRLDDLVIVSGLAYGIDVIAHKAALEAGIPTVAVLGHGFSTIYPPSHRDVARRIIGQGALVTDFHSTTGPERNNFLRRNRIIAGLSDATLVIESAATGGALITADLAGSYGRDVLAVPGRTIDARSAGCNGLIKSCRAALVESADDVLYHLNWDADHPDLDLSVPEVTPGKEEKQLLYLITQEPGLQPDAISHRSGIPIQRIFSLLIEMELKSLVLVEPGNRYHARIIPR